MGINGPTLLFIEDFSTTLSHEFEELMSAFFSSDLLSMMVSLILDKTPGTSI